MKCHEVQFLAPLYLSGELDAERRCLCDLHLSSCPACEEALEQQRACDARLVAALGRNWNYPEVADSFSLRHRNLLHSSLLVVSRTQLA